MIVSSSTFDVDFMGPVMMQVAWFCTFLTQLKLDLAVVPHAIMPYSSIGLSLPMYSLVRVTASAPHVVPANFFMRASRTLALVFGLLFPCQPLVESPSGRWGCPQLGLKIV